jgi:chain length determinant protein tyrosine kinase EpsG
MTLQQFLTILRGRWRLLSTIFALVVAGVVAVSLLLPKKYTAVATVLVDVKSPDPILGMVLPAQMMSGYMATQVDIVTSQKVALMVVDALRIAENPLAIERWHDEADGQGSIRHFYAELLLKYLDVKPSRESSLLNIAYSGVEPAFAAAVANAFAQAYVDTSVEIKVEPAKQTRGFFDTQTQVLRDRLEQAQSRLSAYQRENRIVSADERLDVENARLAELSTQLTALQAQTVEAARRERLAQERLGKGSGSDVPEILQNPLVQQLKAEEARLVGRLKEQSAVLGANHPDIVRIREQLGETRSGIAAEIATVTSSIGNTSRIYSQREADIRASLERQRARVLEIKKVRDELAVLQRDVENAQRNFDAASQRLNQTSLESQSTQANIVLLNRAVEPHRPSSPRVLLNTAVGVVLGGLLGIGGALAAELRRRKVRSADDLVAAAEVPVMGVLRGGHVPAAGLRRARLQGRRAGLPWPRRATTPGRDGDDGPGGVETRTFAPTLVDALPADTAPERPAPREPEPATAGPAPEVARELAAPAGRKRRIGEIMVDAGILQEPAVEQILAWAREEGVRFGEAAVQTRLATEAQVQRALAYQFDYPVLDPKASTVSPELVAAFDSRSPLVADLRRLRSRIRARQADGAGPAAAAPLRVVAVLSAGPGEGKTFVAANLAVTFSQMGQRTLLIDGDLAGGRIHEMFGLDNRTGLAAMLNGRILPGSLKRVGGLPELTVICAGGEAPNAADLLAREAFGYLLDSFRRIYDVVIVDTPAVAGEPDAELIAQRAGAAIVVAREGRSDFDAVHELAADLEAAAVNLIGSVLVRA